MTQTEMPGPRVLLVDDEDDLLSAFEFRLKALGYRVSVARNGAETLEQLSKEKARAVLADFMMPEINGIELTRIIKSHPLWYDVKVLLFSCNTEPDFRRKALDLGAEDYLPKTLGAQEIVERLRQIVPEKETSPKPPAMQGAAGLARGLVDMLRVAAEDETLGGPTRLAVASSQRLAEDLASLLGDPPAVAER